jgi:shikimate dehydrogenase
MFPDVTAKPGINYDLLNEKHILFDLVYNPEITSFLRMGQERGCRIITGLKMLFTQAERSWEIWNDESL